MKIIHQKRLINKGTFANSKVFSDIIIELTDAVKKVTMNSTTEFVINPRPKGNGVVPIKDGFVSNLVNDGWEAEVRMSLAVGMNPGPIDLIKRTGQGIFAVEWETGNISSSHRALNKISVGIIQKQIIGGVLILPVKSFAKFLTDRIGNYEEISPYFPMYENLNISEGVIAILGVEHDKTDIKVPLIKKGKDGNATK